MHRLILKNICMSIKKRNKIDVYMCKELITLKYILKSFLYEIFLIMNNNQNSKIIQNMNEYNIIS